MKKLTLRDMQALAADRKGECLSDRYEYAINKLRWKCERGHEWDATPHMVRRGAWCPRCAIIRNGERRKLTIEEMQRVAAARGGRCVSVVYVRDNVKLTWECASGHQWDAIPNAVRQGCWCPHCARRGSSYGERVARTIMEAMFKVPFLKSRPDWLRLSGSAHSLELDGYAPAAKIAFEYHGGQHYEATARHSSEWVAQQQQRDEAKRRICHERGVSLVVIPQFKDHHDLKGCIEQIRFQVLWHGLTPARGWKPPTCLKALDDPLEGVLGRSGVASLRRIAKERGGELISTTASLAMSKLRWRCSEGHEWEAAAPTIRRGSWCGVCWGKGQGVPEMMALASAKGGEFLSSEYLGSQVSHQWRCDKGHEWSARPGNIRQGKWCPRCKGRGISVADMRVLAESRGGVFLSDRYLGTQRKHLWGCAEGHRWQARPDNVRHGTWCPTCKGRSSWETRRANAAARSALACNPA